MTTTATQTSIGSMIAAGLRMAIGYGQKLCADAPADTFGDLSGWCRLPEQLSAR